MSTASCTTCVLHSGLYQHPEHMQHAEGECMRKNKAQTSLMQSYILDYVCADVFRHVKIAVPYLYNNNNKKYSYLSQKWI